MTESESYRKTVELESLAESRLNAISTLETQKFDLVQGKTFFIITIYKKLSSDCNITLSTYCSQIRKEE